MKRLELAKPQRAAIRVTASRVRSASRGCQELPELAVTLERTTAEEPGLLDLPAAVGG